MLQLLVPSGYFVCSAAEAAAAAVAAVSAAELAAAAAAVVVEVLVDYPAGYVVESLVAARRRQAGGQVTCNVWYRAR